MLLWHWIPAGIHCLHCKTWDHHIKNTWSIVLHGSGDLGYALTAEKKARHVKEPKPSLTMQNYLLPSCRPGFLLSALRTRFHRPAQLLTLHQQRSASGGFVGWELSGNGWEWNWKCGLKSGTLQHYNSHRNARPKPVCTSLLHGSARPRCSFSPGELNRP